MTAPMPRAPKRPMITNFCSCSPLDWMSTPTCSSQTTRPGETRQTAMKSQVERVRQLRRSVPGRAPSSCPSCRSSSTDREYTDREGT